MIPRKATKAVDRVNELTALFFYPMAWYDMALGLFSLRFLEMKHRIPELGTIV